MKDELCLCLTKMNDVGLTEMNDVSPSEMQDDWMDVVDRGGLKHISNMMYMTIVSAEMELHNYNKAEQLNLSNAQGKITESEDVQFYWSMVSTNRGEEESRVLLGMILEHWIQTRGHSTATAWHKRDAKKAVQKSKGLRKKLFSVCTGNSTTTTDIDTDDQ